MIFVTGDTHGTIDFAKLLGNDYKMLSKDDYMIICGDCGVVFYHDSSRIINLYQYLPFTVLFIDGNHENFDCLNALPVEIWNGGKIHKVAENIFHLMRGQVYEIDGVKFLTFGGALSLDRDRRVPGLSWWPQEMPTEEDYDEAITNLTKCGFCIDFVLSHDCPLSWMGAVKSSMKIFHEGYNEAPSNIYLDKILRKIRFKHWFFGHYHIDSNIDTYTTALFDSIVPLSNYMNIAYTNGELVSGDCSMHGIPKDSVSRKVIVLGDSTCAHHLGNHAHPYDWWTFVCTALNATLVLNKAAFDVLEDDAIDALVRQGPLPNSNEYFVIISTGSDAYTNKLQVSFFHDCLEKLARKIDSVLPLATVVVLGISNRVRDASNDNAVSDYNETMSEISATHQYLFIPLDGYDEGDYNEHCLYTRDGMLKTARIICQHIES